MDSSSGSAALFAKEASAESGGSLAICSTRDSSRADELLAKHRARKAEAGRPAAAAAAAKQTPTPRTARKGAFQAGLRPGLLAGAAEDACLGALVPGLQAGGRTPGSSGGVGLRGRPWPLAQRCSSSLRGRACPSPAAPSPAGQPAESLPAPVEALPPLVAICGPVAGEAG